MCFIRAHIIRPSPKHPTPKDILRAGIEEALKLGEGSWCHFDVARSSLWAEVAPDERGLLINLPYPYRDRPKAVFAAKGLDVPAHWQIEALRTNGLFFHGYITYLAPAEDIDVIIAFLDQFFTSLSGKGSDYRVFGSVQS